MRTVPLYLVNRGKPYQGEERRSKPRIYYPIPIKIRGKKRGSNRLEFETVADDLSAGGFSTRVAEEYHSGQRLFLLIHFSLAKDKSIRAAKVAAHGVVLRTRKRYDGMYNLAVAFSNCRFV
jgi:hypothetical protein